MSSGEAGCAESSIDFIDNTLTSWADACVEELETWRPMADTKGLDFVTPPIPKRNWTAAPIPGEASSSFNVGAFRRLLRGHPSPALRDWVLQGLAHGFDNGSAVEEKLVVQPPHKSAQDDPAAVTAWLDAEERRGHIQSFARQPHPFVRACPVGLVPKGHDPAKKRFISDLSAGEGSVNSFVEADDYRIRMVRFQDVVDIAAEFGADCHATFVDVRSAYRNLPLSPANWHLQVYFHKRLWWVDQRISFGSTSSAFIFDWVACAIEWIAQEAIDKACGAGSVRLVHYLDDFALVARSKELCGQASAVLFSTFTELGVKLA
jgi:hypothetical protein